MDEKKNQTRILSEQQHTPCAFAQGMETQVY